MRIIKFRKVAYLDISEIAKYTIETFGYGQWKIYDAAIDQLIDLIAKSPQIGVRRKRLGINSYSIICQEHIIFYRTIGEDILEIERILHQKDVVNDRYED